MKSFFVILPLLFFVQGSFAQYKEADSLKRELHNAKQGLVKEQLLSYLCVSYVYAYPDSAEKYGEQAFQLYRKDSLQQGRNALKAGEVTVLNAMGEAEGVKGDYVKNLATQLKALQLAEDIGDKMLIHRCMFFIGTSYIHANNLLVALNYFYTIKNSVSINHTSADIKYLANKTEDIRYIDNEIVLDAFIGMCDLRLNKSDSAQYYIQRSYRLDLKAAFHSNLPYSLMGSLYTQKGQYKQALQYTRMALALSGANFMKIERYTELAGLYQKTGMPDSAIYYAEKVIRLGRDVSISEEIIIASEVLTEIFKARRQVDSAFKYQGILLAARDSLFSREKVLQFRDIGDKEVRRQQDIAVAKREIITRIRLYILIAAIAVFLLIGIVLWRSYRKVQKANLEIQKALTELKSTQTQLIQSEKMASLGELTAGIAHEIQNPLNFVNNFSEVNREMLEELKAESQKPKAERDEQLEAELISDLVENQQKINHHGKRADAIVKGMLEHSRASTGQKQPTDLNKLAEEYLRLAYQNLKAKDDSFNVELITHFDERLPPVDVVPQDIGRVLLNLFNNAFYAVNQKVKTAGPHYKPTVTVSTSVNGTQIAISIKDNGPGIPENIKEKIMQPFFTTKPTGEGTGLGLSLTYDIVVKGHGGTIRIDSKEGDGAEFVVSLST